MKDIINKLNLNCKQFSELYEIPYMTVNQWYNGKRSPPKWVVKLFNELIESKKKGKQIQMNNREKCYAVNVKIKNNEWRKFFCENEIKKAYEEKEFWQKEPGTEIAKFECWEKVY